LELLTRQKAQGVTGKNCRSASPETSDQASSDHLECGETQVSLRLSSTCRKPDEIDRRTVLVSFVGGRSQAEELEPELEGSPVWFLARLSGSQLLASYSGLGPDVSGLQNLLVHRGVGELECQQCGGLAS